VRQGSAGAHEVGRDGSLISKELGLRFVPEGDLLRAIDLATGERLLTGAERATKEKQLREQEQQRAAQERQLREQEQQRAAQERQLREQEQQRAEALAAEVERLRRLLSPGRS
jgi:hypothetical protein